MQPGLRKQKMSACSACDSIDRKPQAPLKRLVTLDMTYCRRTNRQTDRQTDRQAGRQTDRQIHARLLGNAHTVDCSWAGLNQARLIQQSQLPQKVQLETCNGVNPCCVCIMLKQDCLYSRQMQASYQPCQITHLLLSSSRLDKVRDRNRSVLGDVLRPVRGGALLKIWSAKGAWLRRLLQTTLSVSVKTHRHRSNILASVVHRWNLYKGQALARL